MAPSGAEGSYITASRSFGARTGVNMSSKCKRGGHDWVPVLVESYGSQSRKLKPTRFNLLVCANCLRIPAASYPEEAAA